MLSKSLKALCLKGVGIVFFDNVAREILENDVLERNTHEARLIVICGRL